ncbi:unnamed protein product [Closterium sp. NIES-53]
MEAEGSAPAGPSGSGGVRGAGEAGRGVVGRYAPIASVSTPAKDDVKAFNLEKVFGEDWASWSFRMELLFNHYGLFEVMDGATKEWDRRSKDGFFLLSQCLSSNQLHHVKHLIKEIQCGPKAWKILKDIHAPSSEAMVVVLERQLHAMKINEGDAVQGAFDQLRDLYVKLSAAGVDYPEKIKCYMALSLLPKSWGPLVVNLNGMKDSWSLEWIRAQVLQEEFRRKELTAAAGEGGSSAYGMKGFKGRGSKKGKAKEGSGGEQYSRGKRSKGVHGAMGEGMGSEEGDGGASGYGGMFYHVGEACSEDMVVPASKVALHRSSHCVIDTGAFMTMTNREDLLDEDRPSKAATVVSATGQVVPMRGQGRAMFMGADGRLVGLKHVLLVPGLCANLLSTKALSEAGMKMELMGTKVFKATLDGRMLLDLRGGKDMHQSMWEIPVLPWKEATARLAAEALRGGHASHVTSGGGGDGSDGGLLVHGGGALPSVTPSTGETDWLTAHRHFGHVALPQLQQLFKEERVKGLRIKGEPKEVVCCETCLTSKISRFPFHSTVGQSSDPVELVHVDLVGPMKVKGDGGALYSMTMVDDYTRLTWSFPLAKKSDAARVIIEEWLPMVERESGKRVKAILSDRGGEFLGAEFRSWLKRHGIKQRLTTAYTPQSNGVAERANRTIIECGRKILVDSGLPLRFWPLAIHHATVIKNRKPLVDMLRVFRCMGLVHVPKEKRDKLQAAAVWAVHLGLARGSKGWLMWDPKSNTIFTTRDAKFMEGLMFKEWSERERSKVTISLAIEVGTNDPLLIPIELSSSSELTEVSHDLGGKRDNVRGGAKEVAAKERPKRAAHPRDFLKYEGLGVPKALLVQEEEDEEEKGAEGEMEQICCFGVNLPHEPASMEEALAGDDREAWLASREDEFQRGLERRKTRLVIKGFQQKEGINFQEVFAPVAKAPMLRLFLAAAAVCGWKVEQMDVKRAFLYGMVDEEIYMKQPKGYDDGSRRVCKLNKAIYGLKQAPRCWYARLVEALEALGFKVSGCDESLFMTEGEEEKVFLLVYVDDILLFSPSLERIKEVQRKLKDTFQCKVLGPVGYYLGLDVEWDEVKGWLRLHQHKYLAAMGEKYGLEEGRSVKTPLPSGFQLHLDEEEGEVLDYELQRWFQSMVGSLMYASVNTRPDIAFSVSQLARVVSRPLQEHLDAAERLVRYCIATSRVGLQYSVHGQLKKKGLEEVSTKSGAPARPGHLYLSCFTDATWASDISDATSHGSYICCVGGSPVSWKSKKQGEIAHSSTESEYMALFHGVKEVVWMRRLLEELGQEQEGGFKGIHDPYCKWTLDYNTFDESVPFYRLFPYHSAPSPPPPLCLAPGPPPVDPLPPLGPAPSGVSQVDPLPGTAPVQGAGSGGAEPEGVELGGAESDGAELRGVESEGAESGGAEPRGADSSGGLAGASPRLSSQQLREWLVQHPHHWSGAPVAGERGDAGAGGPAVTTGVGDPTEPGATGSEGAGEGIAGVGGPSLGGAGAAGAGAVDPGAGGAGGTVRPRPYFVPLLQQCALGTDVLEDRQEDFECLAAAVPCFASLLLAPEGDPDAPDIPTPRSYVEAITGPYSSHWQTAMDAEMESWKSTGTYVVEVPPPGVNIVDGMWIFRVKRPPSSPHAFKACYAARGFSQQQVVDYFQTFSPTLKMTTLRMLLHVAAQRDYELHSLDFSTAYLQGSLHEEIWLRRPLGFTGSFPTSTQWSLRRPVYGLRQAPREWNNTLRTILAALGFVPSTADPSLFLRTDTSLPSFYVLVYVDDLVFATADTETLTLVKSELQKRHTCTDLGELRSYLGLQITRDRARRTITLNKSHMVHQVLQRFGFQYSLPELTPLSTSHSLSAPSSDESVEPSGPYPELVGCLMYLMTCTRPDLAYPLSLLVRYVAPDRHRKVHWDAAKRVLRYLCSTLGMGLVLGGRGPVVLTGHADASWVDDSATQRLSQGYTFSLGSGSVSWWSTRSSSFLSSSCEAEIYAGAMAAHELHWLTYLLTDLGEQPRSPPVVYVDNKAMIALCQEHRLEHRTKHIALRYFLARELQQRGQLHLAYVATRANTADDQGDSACLSKALTELETDSTDPRDQNVTFDAQREDCGVTREQSSGETRRSEERRAAAPRRKEGRAEQASAGGEAKTWEDQRQEDRSACHVGVARRGDQGGGAREEPGAIGGDTSNGVLPDLTWTPGQMQLSEETR